MNRKPLDGCQHADRMHLATIGFILAPVFGATSMNPHSRTQLAMMPIPVAGTSPAAAGAVPVLLVRGLCDEYDHN